VRRLNRIGAGGIACFTAGYGELGDSGQRAEAELIEAAGEMALVGPNCYGLVNFTNGAVLWPFGAGNHRCHRGVALIMQSGMLPANMIMNDRSLPISYVISAGNQAVLTIEDYMDLLLEDEAVSAIGMYIEGIKSIGRFAAAAHKALRLNKAVVVLKAGKSSLGSQISVSHTGSLAGTDEAFQALFDQCGMIRVDSPVEMIETPGRLYLFRRRRRDGCRLLRKHRARAVATVGRRLRGANRVAAGHRHRRQSARLYDAVVGQHRGHAEGFRNHDRRQLRRRGGDPGFSAGQYSRRQHALSQRCEVLHAGL
jgi:hypothetical protein